MLNNPQNILIIQTAFIGDVVLSTSLIENLKKQYPLVRFDFVVRKGNEGILKNHPWIDRIITWEKKTKKLRHLVGVIQQIRENKYDAVINVHRYASSGIMTLLARSMHKVGYRQNPFSFAFSRKVNHEIGNQKHEIVRLHELISDITSYPVEKPKIPVNKSVYLSIQKYQHQQYITIAPGSVWFTKQFPQHQWVKFLNRLRFEGTIYFVGGKDDFALCQEIINACPVQSSMKNLCGLLNLQQSAALMKDAEMNFVNDSGPLHLCSAMNAPVTAIFCSTVPAFGFGPLSANAAVIQVESPLNCRPCGIHGRSSCPQGHFNCANLIDAVKLTERIKQTTR